MYVADCMGMKSAASWRGGCLEVWALVHDLPSTREQDRSAERSSWGHLLLQGWSLVKSVLFALHLIIRLKVNACAD